MYQAIHVVISRWCYISLQGQACRFVSTNDVDWRPEYADDLVTYFDNDFYHRLC